MTQPALKAQEIYNEVAAVLLDKSQTIDELQLRRIEKRCRDAMDDAPPVGRAMLFDLLAMIRTRQGKPLEAIDFQRNAVKLNAASLALRNNLAVALLEIGRFEEADEHLRAAYAVDPRHLWVRSNLAMTAAKLGRTSDAKRLVLLVHADAIATGGQPLFVCADLFTAIGELDAAVEMYARFLCDQASVGRDERPATEVIATLAPDWRSRLELMPVLRDAIERVIARDTQPDDSGISAHVTLSPEAAAKLEQLVANPPEPNDALLELLHGRAD